jgi:ComF family protein
MDLRLRPGPALQRPLARAATGILDLVLPPRALDPEAGSVHWRGLTPPAWSRISFIEAPVCDGCGDPFEHDRGPGARCERCDGQVAGPIDGVRAACRYDDHVRDLILALKHGDRTDLAGLFSRWIARAAFDVLARADGVLPVPLHRWRLLRRRFNQSAEIARPLSRQTGVAYIPDALIRRRSTGTQGGKSGEARRRNVEGAFAVSPAWRDRLVGRRLLLIDDVLTTGATAEGCARALKDAGAARVDIAVIAKVGELTRRPG